MVKAGKRRRAMGGKRGMVMVWKEGFGWEKGDG